MAKAKLFINGRSQAVRLPKEFRFEGTEVTVTRVGAGVLLMPLRPGWEGMRAALESFEPGFEIIRDEPQQPEREALDS